jgi:hypothetical protein
MLGLNQRALPTDSWCALPLLSGLATIALLLGAEGRGYLRSSAEFTLRMVGSASAGVTLPGGAFASTATVISLRITLHSLSPKAWAMAAR